MLSIRKRSFFEIVFPLAVVFHVCYGTSFIDEMGASYLRWFFTACLFLYLLLNKQLLVPIHPLWRTLLLSYLAWCMLTTLWSEVPLLSFSKSTVFAANIIIFTSAGCFWTIKYGYERCLDWLLLILITALLSGLLGNFYKGSYVNFSQYNSLYMGLTDNPNTFGFIIAIASSLVLFKLYVSKKKRLIFLFWCIVLIIEVHFLIMSYARSCMVIFLCVLFSFLLSLPLSKKIQIFFLSFLGIAIIVVMMPASFLESKILNHIYKPTDTITIDSDSSLILTTRSTVWHNSYEQAKKGGLVGGGFAVNIGNKHFSDEWICKDSRGNNIDTGCYGREKGNSQFAITEETGIVGLVFYAFILVSFFWISIPYYFRMEVSDRVAMGLVLGAIIGLLLESIVEAWWDSSAGQELICFWTLIGVAFGMIYLLKRKLNHSKIG